MGYLALNNFSTTLTAECLSAHNTISIPPADSALIGAAGLYTAHKLILTLVNGDDMEIVHVYFTDGAGSCSVNRAQQGTTSPASFPIGTQVEARLTAGHFDAQHMRGGITGPAGAQVVPAGRSTSNYIALTSDKTISYNIPSDHDFALLHHVAIVNNTSGLLQNLTIDFAGSSASVTQVNESGLSFPLAVPAGAQVLVEINKVGNFAFVKATLSA